MESFLEKPCRLCALAFAILGGCKQAVTTKDTKDHEGIYFFSVSASTPGNFLPSRNSSEAPPPVEMWVILSATPAALTAATESPPPTIVVAPSFSATASAILKVPLANGGNSKTPVRQFHRAGAR